MQERSIFMAALDHQAPDQRSAFLDQACGNDPALRQRVEELLKSHVDAGAFLGTPVAERLAEQLGKGEGTEETQSSQQFGDDDQALECLAPSDKPGSLGTLGHYEIQELIGRGGMGIVLRASDEKLQRVVAIKVMAPQLATNAAARKRFIREARAAAAISHDHVVTIHAVEEAGGLPYLAMQYVSGLSLQQRLDKSGPLEIREIVRIGMQTAAGLAAAHAQGLIHRDIKPANILLENGVERVKITDFGLARAVADASMTQTGMVAGTPQYMSPEQARGETVDRRSDLFSLGSVLYAMCTGRPPFRGDSAIAVLKRVCDDTPRSICESNPDSPGWLEAIVAKLHAKDPAERYQTAAEVAELLNGHLAHLQHPSVVPLPAVKKPARHVPIRRRLWATAAAVLLCIVGGLGLTEAAGVTKFTASVIRVLTPEGTLIVEVDDPGVKVTIEGDGGLVITGAGPQEVRLRPGSYKVRATKDGKSIRKEELITITRGDKRVVQVSHEAASAPATPTTVELVAQPFVVLGGEGLVEHKFDTLAEAVQRASDGDTIEIRGNGPFVTEPIVITLPSLTIRAGEGFRPVIEAGPEGLRPGVSLLSTKAPLVVEQSPKARLVLEGLEFRCLERDSKAGAGWTAILYALRSLHVANCRFLTKNTDILIQTDFGPPVEVRNCEFYCPGANSAIFPNSPRQSGPGVFSPRLVIDNCLLTARVYAQCRLTSPRGCSIRLTDNTFNTSGTAAGALRFVINIDEGSNIAEADWQVKSLRVEASGNLFETSPVFAFGQVDIAKFIMPPDDAKSCLARMVDWGGERNLYAVNGAFLDVLQPGPMRPANDITDLAGWRQFWGTSEADSVEGAVRFQGGDLLARLAAAPEKLTPDDFRLRPDSAGYRAGKDGNDLGADIDLVGPGPAYERWKKTPEYQHWLTETGQLAGEETTPETRERQSAEMFLRKGGTVVLWRTPTQEPFLLEKLDQPWPTGTWHVVQVKAIRSATLTSADLTALRDFPRLAEVGFSGSQFTTTALLDQIEGRPMAALILNGMPTTANDVARLAKMTTLHQLYVYGADLFDDEIARLAGLPLLDDLNLGGTRITDRSLEQLGRLKLKRLFVTGTNLTDVGLTALYLCKTLQHIDVSRTRVTADGVANLRKSLPECEVVWTHDVGPVPPNEPRTAEPATLRPDP